MTLSVDACSLDDPAAAARTFRHHFRGAEGGVPEDENLRIPHNLAQQILDSDEPGPVSQSGRYQGTCQPLATCFRCKSPPPSTP